MLAYPITAALLVASVAAETHPRVLKNDFLRAMTNHRNKRSQRNRRRKLSVKDFQADLHGDSAKSMALRKKVFQKASFVKPGQESWREEKPTASVPAKKPASRRLDQDYNADYNGYNANGDGDDDGAYNGQNWQQDAQDNYQAQREYYNNNGQNKYNQYKDGSDDYFQAYGEWENEFGFDVTQYSLSYARCASVKQYDDEIAATEDTTSVFATKRFAVFRFCPEMTCMGFNDNNNGNYECNEDYYGEDYCEYMEEYAEYYEELSNYQQQQQAASQKYGWMNNYGEGQSGGDDAVEWEPEDQEEWGANGEGCQNNYGEYLIELEEYLQMMMEWQEERFETYCQYCEQCMYAVYEKWLQNGGGRKLSFEDFKASEEHRQLRQLSTEHRELGGYYGQCPEYDTCVEYQNMCGGGGGEYDDYMECTEVEGNNGRVAYVGPHCSEDGLTVTLGVYSDEYCNDYIGNGVNIANFIGEELDIEEDALKQYYNSAHGTLDQLKFINEDNVCIPCRKGVSSTSRHMHHMIMPSPNPTSDQSLFCLHLNRRISCGRKRATKTMMATRTSTTTTPRSLRSARTFTRCPLAATSTTAPTTPGPR